VGGFTGTSPGLLLGEDGSLGFNTMGLLDDCGDLDELVFSIGCFDAIVSEFTGLPLVVEEDGSLIGLFDGMPIGSLTGL
jgi:hypothetical protein